ncbi:hypothetical protein PR048_016579 [Dryococelus australis]|uniref:Uncharacterized protein n=1 Tax=Dryococelus australis TaxID=614101 RepID=A0ABQ9HKS2_9NEOP|nr:hypothetical protein PR048_016579 [Dryococelus australis]
MPTYNTSGNQAIFNFNAPTEHRYNNTTNTTEHHYSNTTKTTEHQYVNITDDTVQEQQLHNIQTPQYIIKHPEPITTSAGDNHENVEEFLDTYNTASDINGSMEIEKRRHLKLYLQGTAK